MDVPAQLAEIDLDRTAREKRLSENQMLLPIPCPSTNSVRDALRAGARRGAGFARRSSACGETEDQVMYTLDGSISPNPLTRQIQRAA